MNSQSKLKKRHPLRFYTFLSYYITGVSEVKVNERRESKELRGNKVGVNKWRRGRENEGKWGTESRVSNGKFEEVKQVKLRKIMGR